jgi:hypothetical protein
VHVTVREKIARVAQEAEARALQHDAEQPAVDERFADLAAIRRERAGRKADQNEDRNGDSDRSRHVQVSERKKTPAALRHAAGASE